MDMTGPYRNGALMLLISAALHLMALVLGGGALWGVLALGGFLALLVALGLFRGWRWLAYLAFVGTLFGGIAAMASALSAHGAFAMALWGIAGAEALAGLALFGALWKRRPEPLEEAI